jgi:alpha-galactosidase/6-phospho-beta-glucosidase family protein
MVDSSRGNWIGMDLAFTHTTDPREALDGATYVFAGYRVGGLEALLAGTDRGCGAE